jgi:ankyrin repeat protein
MTHRSMHAAAIVSALLALPLDALALDCPAMPQQSQRDVDIAVGLAVGRLGQAAGPQLQAQTRTITTDLLRRLPRADRVYLEQMMYATYCSSLRDNAALSEADRNTRIQGYNREVRAMLNDGKARTPTPDPRDLARAELARLPVEYTPEAFIKSAGDGNATVVRLFLAAGIDANAADSRGITALMRASARGDLPMMDMLLKAGAAVNARTVSGGGTALSWAASDGQLAAMRLLLKAGAAKDTFDTIFLIAVRRADVAAMRLLVEHGANPRADDGETGQTVGQIAETQSAPLADVLQILLQRGWPVDARATEGETALMTAAFRNNVPLMAALIKAGADVNVLCDCPWKYGGGGSALTIASRHGSRDGVQLLLDAGADVNAAGTDGTPLWLATEPGRLDIMKMLLAKGADPNKPRNAGGESPLMRAAIKDPELVKTLLAAGANVNARAKNGLTALMSAAQRDNPETLRILLDAGAQLESRSQHGRTALMLAVMTASVDAARFLIERGARIDVVDEDNLSIKAYAAQLKGDYSARMLALLERKP